jgi:hypothetical protein
MRIIKGLPLELYNWTQFNTPILNKEWNDKELITSDQLQFRERLSIAYRILRGL